MAQPRPKNEARLQELIGAAKQKKIEVRTEKLLREVGYRARSGHCRLKGQNLILLERNAPVSDQIDFLASVLAQESSNKA